MTNFEIRAMTAADVGAACELARAQGWRDRRRFYDFVLRTSTCLPLVGTIDDRLVATGLGTVSLPVGWIGAIAVSAEQRRQGLGRAMTEEICQRLQTAGCATLSLEATDVGRPMYERMGFRLATYYHQLQADHLAEAPPPPEGSRVRRLERADLPDVFALDRQATGEDRHVALEILTRDGGWMLEDDDGPCGFLLPAERAFGAIVAPRFEDGLFLLDLHRSVTPEGGHVRAGIPDEHAAAWQELRTRDWQETWRAPRMLLGPDVDWRPEWIWGQINSAMG